MRKIVQLDEACQECFVSAAERIAKYYQMPAEKLAALKKETRDLVARSLGPHTVPPRVARESFDMIARAIGVDDPFADVKAEANKQAATIIDELRRRIVEHADPFDAALRTALAGNVIDFVFRGSHNLLESVEKMSRQPLAIDDSQLLKEKLSAAKSVLVLGDNVGETWCDRLLIEQFPPHVHTTYAVREKPVLNDVTYDDAVAAGLDQVADVISSGSDAPGTLLDLINDEMRDHFANADVIISKGQGNFEALYGRTDRPIFYLFLVKCVHVEKIIGHPVGSGVIWRFPSTYATP